MDQKDWQILKILQEEKNITKAAERLYISQPALTYRIKSLEKEFGVQILHRSKHGIKFTHEGEYLVNYAEKTIHEFQIMKDHLKNMNDFDEGIIRLGVSRNFARYMLPDILAEFLLHYKKVQFNVITSWSQSIIKLIEKDKINIAIMRGENFGNYEKILLTREPIYIINHTDFDLTNLPSLPRINFKTDPGLQKILDRWWNENFSVPPLVTMEIDNIETCLKLVNRGLGYAAVPGIGLKEYSHLNKKVITDSQNEPIVRETWLIYKETDLQYPIISKFIDFISGKFNDTV
jgi:DNA-binding transcriptional LysR family regulator